MRRSTIVSVLSDKALADEIREKLETEESLPNAREWNVPRENLRAIVESPSGAVDGLGELALPEAIVLLFGRPALLVKNDTFSVPRADFWKTILYPKKTRIESALKAVGRIELLEHPSFAWVGTGWMVAEDILVTNRHVASEFGRKKGKAFAFRANPDGKLIRARVDFKEEYRQSTILEIEVEKVIHIEDEGDQLPDMAFVKLKREPYLPAPIVLSSKKPGEHVAVIGYPAKDFRNGAAALSQVFGDIYEVKRLSPGKITSSPAGSIFTHDCSTLGGNSGSVVLDIDSGEAVGLHFGGVFQRNNYAVKSLELLKRLRRLKVVVPVREGPDAASAVDIQVDIQPEVRTAAQYKDREGYSDLFLGAITQHRVPLPKLGTRVAADAVKFGGSETVLKYTHFSLAMSKKRKMALYTATNVDGRELKRVARSNRWILDPRINVNQQAGEDLYHDNDLDRGHLVRRLDPVWGSQEEATKANDDTFHYTNACPQHKDFNQRVWLELEDYMLDNADLYDLKVNVFTGPVFKTNDRSYRGFQLPQQFWKILAIVKDSDRKLSATAYIMSQSDLLTNLEFVFGQFKTYQTSIIHLESLTGMSFGKLKNVDPMRTREGVSLREISRPSDMIV